ncbi:hypothetical protein Gotur_010163 [Gossypium turneri]
MLVLPISKEYLGGICFLWGLVPQGLYHLQVSTYQEGLSHAIVLSLGLWYEILWCLS